MAKYDFRVRAIDNTSAFADRDFSIDVRNTDQEKYVAVTTGTAYSSKDGINWTERQNVGGNRVEHGGGWWVVSGTKTTLSVSRDGIVWEEYNYPNFGKTSNTSAKPSVYYINGQWIGFHERVYSAGASTYYNMEIAVSSTPNLRESWQPVAVLPASTTSSTGTFNIRDVMYVSGQYYILFMQSSNYYLNTGAELGQLTRNNSIPIEYITRIDDLFVAAGASTIYTSRDAVSWNSQVFTLPVGYRFGKICKGNGYIFVPVDRNSSSENVQVTAGYFSTDGGRNWLSTALPSLTVSRVNNSTASFRAIANNGGFLGVEYHSVNANSGTPFLRYADTPDAWEAREITGIPISSINALNSIAGLRPE